MLTEYNHPIDYELNFNPLISDVVSDSFDYKQNFTIKKAFIYLSFIYFYKLKKKTT